MSEDGENECNGVLRFAWDYENLTQHQSETSSFWYDLVPARPAAANRPRGNEARKSASCSCRRGRTIMEKPATSLLWGSIRPLQSRRTGFQIGSQRSRCKDRHRRGIPLGRSLPFGKICGWIRRKFSWKTPWSSGWRKEATISFFCRGGEATESRRAGSQVRNRERLQV